MKFSIEKVGKLTGLSAVTLRNWEKRYGFPTPERADSGHRYYSSDDIEFLKRVKDFLSAGHKLQQIAEFYKQRSHNEHGQISLNSEIVDDVQYRTQMLYESLMCFNSSEAVGHYNILNAKLSPEKFFDRVIEVILRKIGTEWSLHRINIAQEHFASAFLRQRLMSFLCIDLPIAQPLKILAATSANERHEGGLLLLSAHLKFRGYPVNYFGPDLPIQDIIQLVDAVRPQLLMLSYVDPITLVEDLKILQALRIKVLLGGIALADAQLVVRIKKNLRENIYLCSRQTGSDAANFIELICQSAGE